MFKYFDKLFQNYEYHSKSTDLFYRPSKNIFLVRQSLQEVWNRIIKKYTDAATILHGIHFEVFYLCS